MPNLSLALPHGADPAIRWRETFRAHETFLSSACHERAGVRPVVFDSWRRCAALDVDPDRLTSPVLLVDDGLAEARAAHPLVNAMPVVRKLLVEDASDAGVIVIVSDADGRILWAEGDRYLQRRAENIHLMAGAAWRENDIGTNAVGTALAVGDTVQVYGSEHFARSVQPWSCTAAPIRDPWSGAVIGVLDITGGPDVASPQSAFLVRSAVAAVESELRLVSPSRPTRGNALDRCAEPPDQLNVLGRDKGALTARGRSIDISLRHTELLLLLSSARDGLSAGDLAWKMYEHDAAEVTVRAEISRLRKVVPGLVSSDGRYTLSAELQTDAAALTDCLSAGDYGRAVDLYRGELLPRSTAPGVIAMRYRLHGWIRNALIEHADADTLQRYARSPGGREDVQAWQICLERLPQGSSQRAEVAAIISELELSLGCS